MHERQMHEEASFVTLTYSDECVPRDFSLRYRDFQLFMKRLRKAYPEREIRFFMCGEYGETTCRPHYHAIIFGVWFEGATRYCGPSDSPQFSSPVLDRLWPSGIATFGEVTFESAAYVARYIMKKVTGDAAEDHYTSVDLETGEVFRRTPEFCRMSNRRGIGADWFDKFHSDVYPRDYVVVRGKESKPPRYYDKLYRRKFGPDALRFVKSDRENNAFKRDPSRQESSPERLAVKEECAQARVSRYKRKL